MHRAILFWWGTVILLAVAGCLVGLLFLLRTVHRPGRRSEVRWDLPPSSLCLIYASDAEVAEALRMGNARRSARAMSDADIGISFEMSLPEPEALTLKPLSPLPTEAVAFGQGVCALATLPPMYQEPAVRDVPPAIVRAANTLTAAGYEPKIRFNPEPNTRGTATFYVRLDETGRVLHVLRLSPVGEETPWLNQLRKILLRTRGTAAATGRVIFSWNTKDLP